ncbi:MAG: putative rane protein [Thermoplasmata archaeon]|jgi:membrane protein YdbS with pleckstrin-like domain|nr:putative rane protein [Thermoplasmata archaeon]
MAAPVPRRPLPPARAAYRFPTQPDPAMKTVWAIRAAGFGLFYAIPVTFMLGPLSLFLRGDEKPTTLLDVVGPLIGVYVAAWLVFTVIGVVYAQLAWGRYRIEVRDEEVVVHKGVLFRTTSRVPLRKVQDIHVRQGPLLRAFGLASLKLDTAGGYGPANSGRGMAAEGQMPGIRDAHAAAEALMVRVKQIRSDL